MPPLPYASTGEPSAAFARSMSSVASHSPASISSLMSSDQASAYGFFRTAATATLRSGRSSDAPALLADLLRERDPLADFDGQGNHLCTRWRGEDAPATSGGRVAGRGILRLPEPPGGTPRQAGVTPTIEGLQPMPATRTTVTRLAAVIALLALATAVTACDVVTTVTGPREWTQQVTLQDGSTQTITVRDTSGKIANVEIDPPGVQDPGEIANPAGEPNVVLVPWTGGACDTETSIDFATQGNGLAGELRIETSGDVCVAMAVPHLLRLTTNVPMPAASVTLEFAQ